jgi:hypothetical protein
MPSTLNLTLGADHHVAQLGSKITKDDLYGSVKRVVEADGVELERGYLLPDGRLLRKSQLSFASVDAEGSAAEDPIAYVGEAQVTATPSSFETGSSIAKVPMARLADFAVGDVYVIEADLPQGLYETSFNYRASFAPREAYVLVREDASYLLVGERKAAPFVGRSVSYEFFDAEAAADAESDPLDFSMM